MSEQLRPQQPAKRPQMVGEPFRREFARKGRDPERRWYANFQCECGEVFQCFVKSIETGRTQSCGCYSRRAASARAKKHGMNGTRVYGAWEMMKTRCFNRNRPDFVDYGGRGITVCERWALSFEAFLQDMGEPPTSYHSLDRIDVNGNYEPGNCRWATQKQQARNTRRNHFLVIDGVSRCISEWADLVGVRQTIICNRLAAGWSPEDAVQKPVRKIGKAVQ